MVNQIKVAAAILALIRGDLTASCVADEFGVTETQVHRWKDIFQVAGVLALTKALQSSEMISECDDLGEPTTTTRRPFRRGKMLSEEEGLGEPTTKRPARRKQSQRKK